ncbi:MAG: HpcH/HpaI aldolase/citrate lyase family protein [Brevinematales bacterium]|nr:HpcH/HpaI aldolase/citrate lyase family protein [Brevinematales bacterium]
MIVIEKEMVETLVLLKELYHIRGIKAEFEAEGASYQDMVRLRRLTLQAGVPFHVKIGGVEAVRDMRDCMELGVDGIIAPMVESPFGVKKFRDAYQSVFAEKSHHLAINIETRQAVAQLEDILEVARGWVDAITIGRTDLSASFFAEEVTPESDILWETVDHICSVAGREFTLTLGGNISATTQEKLPQHAVAHETLKYIETRKVILPIDVFLYKTASLSDALYFEKLFILSKKATSDCFLDPDLKRLAKLSERLKQPSPEDYLMGV